MTKTTTRVSTVPANETKRQKFVRIAGGRMTAALTAIGRLEGVWGSGYEHTAPDLERVVSLLSRAVLQVRDAAGGKKGSNYFE
jgi:hypothetical protein